MLSKVPDLLLEHLLIVWPTRGAGIRVLRLVSKEVGRISQQAIRSSAVDLRVWDHTGPQRVVKLVGDACLHELKITVHISEGERGAHPLKHAAIRLQDVNIHQWGIPSLHKLMWTCLTL